MNDFDKAIIEEKQKQIEELKKKKKKISLLAFIVGAFAFVVLVMGVNDSSKTNKYDKETVLFEYKDYKPDQLEHLDKVKVNITTYIPLYSVGKESNNKTAADINIKDECALAITDDNRVIFLLYDNMAPRGGMSTAVNELNEKGIAEIRGSYTTVTTSFIFDFEVDAETADSLAMEFYLMGFADDDDINAVKAEPKYISKIIEKAIKQTGAIKVNLWEKNIEVEEVVEATPESKKGVGELAIAVLLFAITAVISHFANKRKKQISEIQCEIRQIEIDSIKPIV